MILPIANRANLLQIAVNAVVICMTIFAPFYPAEAGSPSMTKSGSLSCRVSVVAEVLGLKVAELDHLRKLYLASVNQKENSQEIQMEIRAYITAIKQERPEVTYRIDSISSFTNSLFLAEKFGLKRFSPPKLENEPEKLPENEELGSKEVKESKLDSVEPELVNLINEVIENKLTPVELPILKLTKKRVFFRDSKGRESEILLPNFIAENNYGKDQLSIFPYNKNSIVLVTKFGEVSIFKKSLKFGYVLDASHLVNERILWAKASPNDDALFLSSSSGRLIRLKEQANIGNKLETIYDSASKTIFLGVESFGPNNLIVWDATQMYLVLKSGNQFSLQKKVLYRNAFDRTKPALESVSYLGGSKYLLQFLNGSSEIWELSKKKLGIVENLD